MARGVPVFLLLNNISPISPLDLPASPLHLPCISPASRLYLAQVFLLLMPDEYEESLGEIMVRLGEIWGRCRRDIGKIMVRLGEM